jgi:SAM-dependent methyltransferase
MKKCLNCGKHYKKDQCGDCGYKPCVIKGFSAFAPELAKENSGFSPDSHISLTQVEKGHFWFESRNKLILWIIKKYFPGTISFCEVGCGTGFVLSGIADNFPDFQLSGSEIYSNILSFTKTRVPAAELFQTDLCNFPFIDEFDLIGAFDVLEHIEDDQLALENIYNALAPGGGVILTVPQHKWLWSVQDDISFHKRRYSRVELTKKVKDAGFEIIRVCSFVSFLLPLMIISRLKIKKNKGTESCSGEFQLSQEVNKIFSHCCSFERKIIQLGVNFPAGGSLLVLGRKKAASSL